MDRLPAEDPIAVALADAIRRGELAVLQRLLAGHPGLARARIAGRDGCQRTPLHLATDWPGYFPNGPAVVELLLAAGADPNAPVVGTPHPEPRCTGRPAATTPMSPPHSSTVEPTWRRLVPRSPAGPLSTTPSATAAGTWPACW